MQPFAQERYPGRLAFAVSEGGTGCSPSGSASRFEGKIHIAGVAAAYSSGSKKAKAARKMRGSARLAGKVKGKMNDAVMRSLEDDAGTKVFARVTKMLGGIRIRVMLEDGSEQQAVLRGLLRKRRHAPIEVGSVVLMEDHEVFAVLDSKAAGVIAHMGRMPVWMAANGDHPSLVEEDDLFDRSVTLAVDEDGNVKVDGSDLAQLITYKFCKPAMEGGDSGKELTEAEVDAI